MVWPALGPLRLLARPPDVHLLQGKLTWGPRTGRKGRGDKSSSEGNCLRYLRHRGRCGEGCRSVQGGRVRLLQLLRRGGGQKLRVQGLLDQSDGSPVRPARGEAGPAGKKL